MKNHNGIDEITLSYLNLQTPQEHRGNIFIFFLVFLDIIGLLPILGESFSALFFWPAIIPIGLLHIAAIVYMIAPYKFEHSYYLFFGVYGVVNTFIYFLVIQKLLYINIGIESQIVFILGAILLILLLVFFQWFNIKMLYSGTYAKLQQNKKKISVSPIITATAFGYIIAQFIMSALASGSIKLMVIITLISILSVVTAFFSIYIHRYFFIRKNYEIVKRTYPEFGLPKNLRRN
ncbi:hypothetical protein [Aquibacillus rhizosphaerae]|uniref:Uncharacterized protein n=1 Tax=Aquibacillus rhizosphaerae TaxID=3051431 RepID=A0ABT7L9W6_9BACI|nr:hypothetical protein [Aquibacillus sp. LR5S19]MDL4842643.1 hypothetical protein [Aquibacillus sp. LR5S19]